MLAEDGSVVEGRSAPGRGAWVCRDEPACLERAVRQRAFDRALRLPGAAPGRRATKALERGRTRGDDGR